MTRPSTDLSFDPRDPFFPVPGNPPVRWGVQVFTTNNAYGLDASSVRTHEHGPNRTLVHADQLTLLGQQRPAPGGDVNVELVHDGPLVSWQVTARHDEPIKAVKLLLTGLPAEVLRRGWWTPNTGVGTAHGVDGERFRLTYPGPEWVTPWVAAGDARAGLTLSVRDEQVRRHVVHVRQPPYRDEPIVELVQCADATRFGPTLAAPPVRARLAANGAATEADFEDHLGFVERAHGLVPWERRGDVPRWLRSTALVVTLHGQHWTGYVFNTFARMAETLEFVAQHIDPRRVLAHLPGWEGRYYQSCPVYRPGEELGGAAGFADLVSRARRLGCHLMPMFGANGVNVTRYPDWESAAIRNDTDRYVELLNRPDWDGDQIGEGDQVFLNPGEPGFRRHLVESISALVREFGVDAAFLDTVGYWFNDPRFRLLDGYRALADELRERHPELLLAAEGSWDALAGIFPLSQRFLGSPHEWRYPQAFARYVRLTGHLAEGTPGTGSTGVHELGFLPRPPDVPTAGTIPVVSVADHTLTNCAAEIAAICRWAEHHAPGR